MVLEDNLNKVGVRFDKPVYGGNNLVDLCEDGHGFFCNGIVSCSFEGLVVANNMPNSQYGRRIQ